MTPSIVGETRPVAACGHAERRACFELLDRLFLGVRWDEFVRDFDEKDAVILLRDAETGTIGGFSTVTELELLVAGELVPVVFSGDTAVLPEYRTSLRLGQELVRYLHAAFERHPGRPVSYVLISKGWRTYKILPFFFREFFPRHDAATPHFERALIDAFGKARYPGRYRRRGDPRPATWRNACDRTASTRCRSGSTRTRRSSSVPTRAIWKGTSSSARRRSSPRTTRAG